MNNQKTIIAFILAIFCSGCTSKYTITYNSEPQGASLVCNGVNHGYTPVTLYYDVNKSNKVSGMMRPVPCNAQWSSGATKSYASSFSLTKFPNGVMQTLLRPNVDGYTQDVEFALKVKQMKLQKQQIKSSQPNSYNSKKSCKKIGDLSGRVYHFEGFCPVGYY